MTSPRANKTSKPAASPQRSPRKRTPLDLTATIKQMRDMEAASRALTQAEPQITAAEDTEADHVEAVADAPPEQGKAMHFVKLMFGGKQRRA